MPDAPAAKANLKTGDIIVGLDGRPIESAAQLQVEMLTKKPGETVVLDLMRNDTPLRISVQTRAWPD
jgi:S1-C subfamily serine protease